MGLVVSASDEHPGQALEHAVRVVGLGGGLVGLGLLVGQHPPDLLFLRFFRAGEFAALGQVPEVPHPEAPHPPADAPAAREPHLRMAGPAGLEQEARRVRGPGLVDLDLMPRTGVIEERRWRGKGETVGLVGRGVDAERRRQLRVEGTELQLFVEECDEEHVDRQHAG